MKLFLIFNAIMAQLTIMYSHHFGYSALDAATGCCWPSCVVCTKHCHHRVLSAIYSMVSLFFAELFFRSRVWTLVAFRMLIALLLSVWLMTCACTDGWTSGCLEAWRSMIDAWCLMPDAWCLIHSNPGGTKIIPSQWIHIQVFYHVITTTKDKLNEHSNISMVPNTVYTPESIILWRIRLN